MTQDSKDEKKVVRGLEDVVAAETSVSYVDGVHGRLYYQGYDIHDIAEEMTFSEVVLLLWNGGLPTRAERDRFSSEIVADMRLPSQVVDMLKLTPPTSHPMAVLRTAVGMLAHFDPDVEDISPEANRRKARRLLAQIPTIIADLHRIRYGLPLLSPDPNYGVSSNFLYMLRGTPPTELERKAMRLLMVLLSDHGLNASTFTARVIASTLSDMHSALAGAIGSLKGPLHGGANERVMEMILNISDVDMVKEYIEGMLENRQRIMGFGHRVYRTEDPRATHLRRYSEMLCEANGQRSLYEISRRIEQTVMEAKGIYPNVDFYSATVQHAIGIPPEYYTAIFAASRAAGWIAHIMEQYANNRLMRPTSKYTGEIGLPFVPIDQR
ncbi:MAG: citrate synthase [Anaerolineae bacterium CG2_30_64_16]|nr:MAG: citrate synthase [Anaerolineae bacterium CG2_30_64_16]